MQTLGTTDTPMWAAGTFTENPVDHSLWLANGTWGPTWVDESLQIYRKRTSDSTFLWESTWLGDVAGRIMNPSGLVADALGNIWVIGYTTSAGYADHQLFIRKRATNGTWSTVATWQYLGGNTVYPAGIAIRNSELWFTGRTYDASNIHHWYVWKYDTLTPAGIVAQDISPFTHSTSSDQSQPMFIRADASGILWLGGWQKKCIWNGTICSSDGVPYAVLMKDDGSGNFSVVLATQPGNPVLSGYTDIAFDATGHYWLSNYHRPAIGTIISWSVFEGDVASPSTEPTSRDTGYQLFAGKDSGGESVVVHPSGEVFVSGYGLDASSNLTQLIRRGGSSGFSISDQIAYPAGYDVDYANGTLFIDSFGNIWARHVKAESPTYYHDVTTRIRKLSCN
ncbi:hypothetical protein WDW37_10040 [Bdellovibrionota bacterium FG-1]